MLCSRGWDLECTHQRNELPADLLVVVLGIGRLEVAAVVPNKPGHLYPVWPSALSSYATPAVCISAHTQLRIPPACPPAQWLHPRLPPALVRAELRLAQRVGNLDELAPKVGQRPSQAPERCDDSIGCSIGTARTAPTAFSPEPSP